MTVSAVARPKRDGMQDAHRRGIMARIRPLPWIAPILATAWIWLGAAAAQTPDIDEATALRVCSDPDNMPFSNQAGEGFENQVAELLAARMGRRVAYTWFPLGTGFLRQTLLRGKCDVIMGYAQRHSLVLTTRPYYTSAYVFVTRRGGPLDGVEVISDPRLKGHVLGVVAGSPPAAHMVDAGLIGSARPYRLLVDRRLAGPAEAMIRDLLAGEIDGAFLWGPAGGYAAEQAGGALSVTPMLREQGRPRMHYHIAMGVRRDDYAWKERLDTLLEQNAAEIDAILTRFGVPLVDRTKPLTD